jgi:capsid protein
MAENLTKGQRTYEEERARKAGMSLDAWLKQKAKKQADEAKAASPPPAPKKPGLLSRLIDRAHKPIK